MLQQATQLACYSIENRKNSTEHGIGFSASESTHRIYALKISLRANLLIEQLQLMKPALDAKGGVKLRIGYSSNLASDYIQNAKANMKKEITSMTNNSFKEFTLNINSSPVGNDLEAACICLIRKKTLK